MFHAQSMKISGLVQPYVMKFFPVHIDAKESAAHVENRHFMKNAKTFAQNVYHVVMSLIFCAVRMKKICSALERAVLFLNVVMCAVELVVIVIRVGYIFRASQSVVGNLSVVTHVMQIASRGVLLVTRHVRCLVTTPSAQPCVENPV